MEQQFVGDSGPSSYLFLLVGKQRQDWLEDLIKSLDNDFFEEEFVFYWRNCEHLFFEELKELLKPIYCCQFCVAHLLSLGHSDQNAYEFMERSLC